MMLRNPELSIYPLHGNFEDDERYLKLGAKYGLNFWYAKTRIGVAIDADYPGF